MDIQEDRLHKSDQLIFVLAGQKELHNCDLPRDSEALLKINHKSKDGRSQTFSQICA